MSVAAPWAALDIDPDRIVAELRRRFPGARAWYGEYTGAWWAITRDRSGRDRLVEASDPAELGRRLEEICGRMAPRLSRAAPLRPEPSPSRAPRSAAYSRQARRRGAAASRGGWWRRVFRR
ncbi:hypothetical protein [Actinomadura rugatobispora]|uniref:Uncharacterized protein n=1 Tax=Actinomadura rugatobispora TaxID=1994 RepID=A0ABW1A6Y1_9ACTN|nr:hypothetical protein GCM10010200_047870 [Actinomadura rugatobispora]